MHRLLRLLPVALLALALVPPPAAPVAVCPPSNSHVWFLGVVDDSEERADFKQDVFNFEAFLTELRDVYCIPPAQAKILAFDGNFTTGPNSNPTYHLYTEASEQNVKSYLASFGTAANAHTDSLFFFFLSSHGLAYSYPLASCGVLRTYGSFSALHSSGPGQDGVFYDCELGNELNTKFDPDVRMLVAVDCSFCGGFSDSLAAASGTVPDGAPQSSGIPRDNRIVWTGCAMTTECFGGGVYGGAVFYDNLRQVLNNGIASCDGWTAPGFPAAQGINVPIRGAMDGKCKASEWFYAAVFESYLSPIQPIGIQEQFRMKYYVPTKAAPTLAADIQVFG